MNFEITYIHLVILFVVLLVFVFAQQFYAGRYRAKLVSLLYRENKPQEYLKMLDSFQSKFLIPSKRLLFLKLDGYAMLSDSEKMEEIFEKLRLKKLSYGMKIALVQKEVPYYIEVMKLDKAQKSYEEMLEYASMLPDNADIQSIAENLGDLIDLYVGRSGKLGGKMEALARSNSNRMIKGIYLYRAAKSYYYDGNNKKSLECLKDAKHFAKGSYLEGHIVKCISDLSLLDNK